MECAFTSPVRTECGMFMIYCMQCCMSVSAVLNMCVLNGSSMKVSISNVTDLTTLIIPVFESSEDSI